MNSILNDGRYISHCVPNFDHFKDKMEGPEFGHLVRKIRGFDRTDITENVRNIVTISSHHVDILILQDKCPNA